MAKNIELRDEQRLTSRASSFRRPAWSPDGRIALEADVHGGSIYLLDAKGRLERQLLDGAEAAWSPDGARLAFTRVGDDGRRAIWVCDVAAPENAYRLAGSDGGAWEHPAWSPSGEEIACASDYGNPGGLRHVWVLDASHGARRRITCDPQRSDGHPAWSPDGRAIAFDADDRADDARDIDVYVVDLRTGTLTCLSDGAVATRRPVFVDRRYLLAERRSVAGPTLVALDRLKKRTIPVGTAPSGEREPSLWRSPRKGRVHVAFCRRDEATGRDAVWFAELAGLKVTSERALEIERDGDASAETPVEVAVTEGQPT